MIPILDVEEQEGPGHEHSQYGDGGQDAVEWHVDVAPLQTHKRPILRWLYTYKKQGLWRKKNRYFNIVKHKIKLCARLVYES